MSTLAPNPALLDTAEGNSRVGDACGVDSDHTDLQSFCDSPDPTDIPRIEISCESDVAVVRKLDHLLLGFELDQGCDGSEGLFLTEER